MTASVGKNPMESVVHLEQKRHLRRGLDNLNREGRIHDPCRTARLAKTGRIIRSSMIFENFGSVWSERRRRTYVSLQI
jgi:hypothetical protein